MPNIKFSYLYRDGSNYKNYWFVIFATPNNLSLEEVIVLIKSKLIDSTWFYAHDWQLPDLRSQHFDIDNDPTWHEYEGIILSSEEPNIFCNMHGETFSFKPIS